MQFEFDPAKSAANKARHGIDFATAQELWEDEFRLQLPARGDVEPRTLLIARRGSKLWTAVFTMRGDNIRIISVRRARDNEREAYEQTPDQDNG